MYKIILISFALILTTFSCEKEIFGIQYNDNPVDNFEAMWSEFDQLYGLFKVRNIDWDSVYQVYRPQVRPDMSDNELYEVLSAMIAVLDDSHVLLLPTLDSGLPRFSSGMEGRIERLTDFNLDIVKANYLENPNEIDEIFTYGYIAEGLGYLYIAYEPGDKTIDKHMPDILDFFQDADRGLIIDIRDNSGGEDRGGQAIASYFTDQRRLYMRNSIKNGPGPDDFTAPQEWYISPKSQTYDKPLVLLTQRTTVSAGETLALALRTLPQLTMMGDTTMGAFSNAVPRELPNGWGYSISIGDWRAADGTSYEGVGIPPEEVILNQEDELRGGKDTALEQAIAFLE